MRTMRRCFVSLVGVATFAACMTGVVSAQPGFPESFRAYAGERGDRGTASAVMPPQLEDVSFKQRLDEVVPLDAMFVDETGRTVALGDFFGRRPVVLAFVYYTCPMLCTQVMNGMSSALAVIPFTAGQDFEVVLVSFDPRDTPASAAEKKRAHLEYWSAEQDAPAWHLLTGDEATIRRVTSAAGFTYRWDEPTGQFAHVSGVLVVTPEGRLSRYFYGIEYSPKELRMALVESGQGRVGSAIDELLLYCFHYDPESGRYGVVVMNLIRLGGVLTLLFIGGFIVLMRRGADPPAESRA
ncbi:MAG: SCO family protein [Acidobacteria bacterium]|nr:SCO family protein [Acidobacteriota bacterium]